MSSTRYFLGAAGGAFWLVLSSLAQATVVVIGDGNVPQDNSLLAGTSFDAQYQALGVDFSNNTIFTSGAGVFNVVGNRLTPGNEIIVTFDRAVKSVSLDARSVGGGGIELQAFDSLTGGSVIDSDSATGPIAGGGSNSRALSVAATGIRRIEFANLVTTAGDSISLDPLTIEFNDLPTAEANQGYSLSGSSLVETFSAAGSSDPDGTIDSYSWSIDGGSTVPGLSPTISLAESGFANSGDADKAVTLTVTDDQGDTATDTAILSYDEVAPAISGASLTSTGGLLTLAGTVLDADLLANAFVSDFESGSWRLEHSGAPLLSGDWGSTTNASAQLVGDVLIPDLVALLGMPGIYDLNLIVTDAAGLTASQTFANVAIGAIPTPGAALFLLPVVAWAISRKR